MRELEGRTKACIIGVWELEGQVEVRGRRFDCYNRSPEVRTGGAEVCDGHAPVQYTGVEDHTERAMVRSVSVKPSYTLKTHRPRAACDRVRVES